MIAGLPWVVKPLYGFISDTVPIFGMRRRPYLIACGVIGELQCFWEGSKARAAVFLASFSGTVLALTLLCLDRHSGVRTAWCTPARSWQRFAADGGALLASCALPAYAPLEQRTHSCAGRYDSWASWRLPSAMW